MERRAFVGAACCALAGVGAGCLSGEASAPESEIDYVELENHRREEGYEFTVRIEDEDEIVFEETHDLGAAGSGDAAVALEDPVAEPGSYSVLVEAGERAASADTPI